MIQKKFEQEIERIEDLRTQLAAADESKVKEFWWYLLQIIFQELGVIIFTYDQNDKIVLNEKGNPKINWLNALANIPTILAKISAIITEYEKFKEQWQQD